LSDYRDLWHPEFAVSRWPVTNMLVSLLNRWMLRRPSAVSTVSEGLAGYLRKLVHCKVWVCYNGFLEVNTSKLPPAPRPDGKVHLVYTGNFYRGKRDPAPLLDALGALKAVNREAARRLRVDFYGPAEAWVRRLVSERGLDDLVLLHGNVSYGESIARQRAADMLLFVDWMDTRAQGVLTGKLFEYLASGRPILSVGKHRETEAARLIVACKAGMVATTIAETQDALFTLVSGSFSTMHDWEKIRTFSRRAQATALLDEIEKYFKGAAQ
jgi:glycosyltransferase involved in cell wall biosynthesis